jgi:hypothetical protein
MDKVKRPVYKGLRRLRYSDLEEEIKDAWASPYRWWWSYLRLSKDYWWVCQQQGETLDDDLRKMWLDFGNVFATSFNAWWRKQGRNLFAEQVRLPHVRKIDNHLSNLSSNAENHLLVEIPLNLTERTISRQVLALIRADPARKVKPVSKAKRPLCKLRGIKMSVLVDAHNIWCLNYLIDLATLPNSKIGKPFDRMTSQQLGTAMRLVRSCMPKYTDGEDVERKKRNGMKVAVSRMLSRADALIANAEIGIFPSMTPAAPRRRWTAKQQLDLDKALAVGKWTPPAVDEDVLRKLIGKPKLPG